MFITQIKQVQESLFLVKANHIMFTLTCSEHTPLGQVLNKMYYSSNILECLPKSSWFGCPHSGGQHKFTYSGPPGDAIAFIELMQEELANKLYTEEARAVLSRLSWLAQDIIALKAKKG